MYVNICIFIRVHVYTCIYVYLYIYVMYTYILIHTCPHICMHVYVVYIHTTPTGNGLPRHHELCSFIYGRDTYACMCIYTRIYIYVYTCHILG